MKKADISLIFAYFSGCCLGNGCFTYNLHTGKSHEMLDWLPIVCLLSSKKLTIFSTLYIFLMWKRVAKKGRVYFLCSQFHQCLRIGHLFTLSVISNSAILLCRMNSLSMIFCVIFFFHLFLFNLFYYICVLFIFTGLTGKYNSTNSELNCYRADTKLSGFYVRTLVYT